MCDLFNNLGEMSDELCRQFGSGPQIKSAINFQSYLFDNNIWHPSISRIKVSPILGKIGKMQKWFSNSEVLHMTTFDKYSFNEKNPHNNYVSKCVHPKNLESGPNAAVALRPVLVIPLF